MAAAAVQPLPRSRRRSRLCRVWSRARGRPSTSRPRRLRQAWTPSPLWSRAQGQLWRRARALLWRGAPGRWAAREGQRGTAATLPARGPSAGTGCRRASPLQAMGCEAAAALRHGYVCCRAFAAPAQLLPGLLALSPGAAGCNFDACIRFSSSTLRTFFLSFFPSFLRPTWHPCDHLVETADVVFYQRFPTA